MAARFSQCETSTRRPGDKEGKDEKEGEAEHHKGKADLTTVTVDPSKLEHPDWDSESGPILKVYITSFATQHE